MRTHARVAGRLVLVAGSVAMALILGEVTLRILKPQLLGIDAGAMWEPVQGLRWNRRPNLDVRVDTGEREVRLITDAARHRIGAAPGVPGDIRILAIGDSMVDALQVEAEQTMTALLGSALSKRLERRVEVVNAGVGGWDPNQYLIRARQELEQSSYALVLIFVYLDNDIVSRRVTGYPPATELNAPPVRPFEDSASTTVAVLGARLAAVLSEHSHLFVFSRNLFYLRDARAGTRIHLLSNAMRSNAASPAWGVTADILRDIADAGTAHHAPVLFVLLPSAQDIDKEWLATLERGLGLAPKDVDVRQAAERLGAELRMRRLDVFDPAPALQQAFEAGEHNLYGHIDPHFAPAGHQVMARFLEPIVLGHLANASAR